MKLNPSHPRRVALAASAFVATAAVSHAAALDIPLASTMDGNSFVSEGEPLVGVTSSFARINAGDGSLGSAGANTGDADGLYGVANVADPNPGPVFGTPVDLFPREEKFLVGGVTVDTSGLTGSGVEVAPVTALDLGELWKPDPNRTSSTPGSPPTVVSDISDRALGLWFFDSGGSIDFGAIDASDTATFTDGLLTSIDVEVTAAFILTGEPSFDGTLTFSGDQISLQINETELLFSFLSTPIVLDITGTVNAVNNFVIPEPASAALLLAGVPALALRRRRAGNEQKG
ncbi:MAG: PEP-CTERM sorting domain-containing protein [Planctomycetota bacterium]